MNQGFYLVNLGADPESITLGDKEGRKLRVADNTPGKKSITRWFNAIVSGRDVATCDEQLEKGSTIILTGQLQQEEYSPKKARYKGEKVKVDTMPFAKIFMVVKGKAKAEGEDGEEAAADDGITTTEDGLAGSMEGAEAPVDDLPF